MTVSFSKGSGANYTMVRYKTGGYPTGPTDGTQAYWGTGTGGSVSSLTPGVLYYFRAYSYKSASAEYNTSEYSQQTAYTLPAPPTSFVFTEVTTESLSVSWTKGAGADNTLVRYKLGSYPTNTSDGTQAYNSSGTSVDISSLDPGTLYYFRAWSYKTASSEYNTSEYLSDTETTQTTPTGWTGKIGGISSTNIGKIGGISITDIGKIGGIE